MRFDSDIGTSFGVQNEVALTVENGVVAFPDAHLLFRGDFEQTGQDLIVSNADAAVVRISDYFGSTTPADIVSPDGAVIRGADVVRLSGGSEAIRVASSHTTNTSTDLENPIGQVENLSGTATATRADGSRVSLSQGDFVYQNDVVETTVNGSVSLTFVDGTIFSLSASSRMILDELIFDPDGSDNTATFNLIQGSFVFIAGQVAKTGGMDVETPASTLAIRGTTVQVRIIAEDGNITVVVGLLPDPGTDEIGEIDVEDLEGNRVAIITNPETILLITPSTIQEVQREFVGILNDQALEERFVEAVEQALNRVAGGEPYVSGDEANANPGTDTTTDPVPTDTPIAPSENPNTDSGSAVDGGNGQATDGVAPSGQPANNDSGDNGESGPESGGDSGTDPANPSDPLTGPRNPSSGTPQNDGGSGSDSIPGNDPGGSSGGDGGSGPDGGDSGGGEPDRQPEIPVNFVPVAGEGGLTVSSDGNTATGALQGTDLDGAVLGFALVLSQSSGETVLAQEGQVVSTPNGKVVVTDAAAGTYEYTPNEGFTGQDSFAFVVLDSNQALSEPAMITITVAATNSAPQARSEPSSGNEDTDISGTITASDPDNDAIAFSMVADPANGSVELRQDGSYTYTPADNFFGDDTFTVEVRDPAGETATVEVSITVDAVNDAPAVAPNISVNVVEGGSLTVPLVVNDPDTAAADLIFRITEAPQNGVASVSASGTYTYTPNDNFSGNDSFAIEVDDGQAQVTTRISIDVGGVNDPPVLDDRSQTVAEGGVLSDTVLATDPDGDALSYALSTQAANGTAVVNADGSYTYTPGGNYAGPDSFVISVTDGQATDTATISVTVTPVNDPPIVGDDTVGTVVGAETIIVVLANDSDPEGTALTVSSVGAPGRGSVTIEPDGSLRYTPSGTSAGTDSFTYTVSDTEGSTTTGAVTVNIADNIAAISTAGSVNNLSSPSAPFELDISDMPFAALFGPSGSGSELRTPTASATEIRFSASDGRSFAFVGSGIDYVAGTGNVTGVQIGTPTNPGFYSVSGIQTTVATIKDVIGRSLVGGSVDTAAFAAFFAQYRADFTGSIEADQYGVNPASTGDSTLSGGGGDDVLLGAAGNDRIAGGMGNDTVTTGQGDDTVVFSEGNDLIQDFDVSSDVLELSDPVLSQLGTATVAQQSFGGQSGVLFSFGAGSHSVGLVGVTLAEALQIIDVSSAPGQVITGTAGSETVSGTIGNDTIDLMGNSDSDRILASPGDDRFIYTNNSSNGAHLVDYRPIGSVGIVANIDFNLALNANAIQKGTLGFDTLVDVQQAARWGFGIIGSAGNDQVNITQNSSAFSFFDFSPSGAGGQDTVNVTPGDGIVRITMGWNGNVSGILGGVLTSTDNESVAVSVLSGDTSRLRLEIRSRGGDDAITGSPFRDSFILGPGTDSADGQGDIDRIRYDRSRVSQGVQVTFAGAIGTAVGMWDGASFTHTFQNIEQIRGSSFGDTIEAAPGNSSVRGNAGDDSLTSGSGDDFFELGAGNDTVVFTGGNDFVDDFVVGQDVLEFGGMAQAQIGTLQIAEYTSEGDTRARIYFDGNSFGINFRSMTLADAVQIVGAGGGDTILGTAGNDDLGGTPGNDSINPMGNSGEDRVRGSAGNDTIDFTGATGGSYYNLDYRNIGSAGITATIDANGGSSTVVKGAAGTVGTDTLLGVPAATQAQGFGITGSLGNDTISVSLNSSQWSWIGIFESGGQETVTINGGVGNVQLGFYNGNVSANLGAGQIDVDGSRVMDLSYSGSFGQTRLELRTDNGNDTVVGTSGADRFILGAGTDSADGAGGEDDAVRYNRNGVDGPVNVNLTTGTAEGTWDGLSFTHSLSNIEIAHGTPFGDTMTASASGGQLDGREGNDTLIALSNGSDVLAGSGNDQIQRAGLSQGSTDGGAGRDTVLLTTSGSFDFSAIIVSDNYSSIEELSVENAVSNADTTLSLQNIFDFSSSLDPLLQAYAGETSNGIMVLGDAGENLSLVDNSPGSTTTFERRGSETITGGDGRTLDVYQAVDGASAVLAVIAVDQDMTVDTGAPPVVV
ncbi:tandem-95 repeat protein [Primorskyibacter sp. S87]|uniref:tandem-95 repeat protein n=1 Tax=Primorskyibacter sp. S87 TaxID=3415126 RepID=UPI003C7AF180